MKACLAIALIGAACSANAAFAQPAQASAMTLAQAHDRCMTGYAVRLTRTDAGDDQIYASAVNGCKALEGQLHTAIAREYPAAEAEKVTAMLKAQARPNFLNMLQKIRTDRQLRSGN